MLWAAMGVGTWATALNVQYRDVRYVIPFGVQMGLFLSPVIYTLASVPARLRPILALNPMTGVIEFMRAILLRAGPLPWDVLAVSAATAGLLGLSAILYYRRMEQHFADVV
jgi:lipopolysaccharide transport system permease protein